MIFLECLRITDGDDFDIIGFFSLCYLDIAKLYRRNPLNTHNLGPNSKDGMYGTRKLRDKIQVKCIDLVYCQIQPHGMTLIYWDSRELEESIMIDYAKVLKKKLPYYLMSCNILNGS